MNFKITESMKSKIVIYSSSLVIALLFFIIVYRFENVIEIIKTVFTILLPFLFGIMIAFILNNPVKWVENKLFANTKLKQGKKRLFATAIVFILALLFLVLFFSIVIPNVIESLQLFSKNVTGYAETLYTYVRDIAYSLDISEKQVEEILFNFDITKKLTNILTDSIPMIASYSVNIVQGFIHSILAIVSAFYMLMDRESLVKGIKRLNYSLFNKKNANYLTMWANDAQKVFEQYIVGNMLDSFIVGVICYIGCLILKMPYASMIGLIVGITNIIPVFGPFLGAIPVIVLLLLIKPFYAIIFAIFIFILQQCDGNIIKPLVLGDKLGISGFWILFSVTVGGSLFGVIGMFLGVPIFALIYAAIQDYIQLQLEDKNINIDDTTGAIE